MTDPMWRTPLLTGIQWRSRWHQPELPLGLFCQTAIPCSPFGQSIFKIPSTKSREIGRIAHPEKVYVCWDGPSSSIHSRILDRMNYAENTFSSRGNHREG